MISDHATLTEIRQSWKGVEALRGRLQRSLLGSFAQRASFVIFVSDSAHNLPFVHAYAVLNDVLKQLENENHFKCKSFFLGALLDASKAKLSWNDFAIIKEGAERRNDVAHRGEVLPRADCWRYIDAIKDQLLAWGVVDSI
jgi:hypothetical protein